MLMGFSQTVYSNTYLTENASWYSGLTASQWTSLVAGDLNNDGYQDLVQIGCTNTLGQDCNGYLAKVYINNGSSFVENSTWQQNLTSVNYGSLALGDVDNDGDLDLVLNGCVNGGGTVATCPNSNDIFSAFYINNGFSFVQNSTWQGSIVKTWKGSFVFGDIDLDGRLDLIVTGATNSAPVSKVYINNGISFNESFFGVKI